MNTKKKTVLLVVTVVLFLIFGKIILDMPYRSQISEVSSAKGLTPAVLNQLTSASQKAFIFPTSENLGMLGMAYHSSSNYEQAAVCYKLAVKKNKSAWIWSYYLGYLNMEMGESANAIECFQIVVKENPKAFHAWYYLGEEYQNLGASDKAEIAYEKAGKWIGHIPEVNKAKRTDYFPLNTYAKCQLARVYAKPGKIEQSERMLHEIIQTNQSFGMAYRLLGSISLMKGDTLSGNRYVLRANDLLNLTTPVDTIIDQLAILSRSELYLLKQIDEADNARYANWELALVNQGLKYIPENKYLISKAIILYLKTGAANQALPFLKHHFNVFNDNSNELSHVANLLFEKRYFTQSNIYYNRVLTLQPAQTDFQVNLILGLVYQGEKLKAINLMEEYIKKAPNNPKVLANAVVVLIEMGEFEKAINHLQKLKQLSPADSKTLLLSGKIAQHKGDMQKAQAFYESAFNKNPEDLIIMKALGDVLMRQKLWKRSILHYKMAMNYFPNEPFVLETLGTLLVVSPQLELRNYPEGKEHLERAFFHKDCPPETMIAAGKSLADASVALGDQNTAVAYLTMVINLAQSLNIPREYLDKISKKLNDLRL